MRTTFDVDVYPAPGPDALRRLADALRSLEPGAPPYGELRARALEIDLGDIRVAVASRDDLISMKRASARPVDLEDLAALTDPAGGNALNRPPAQPARSAGAGGRYAAARSASGATAIPAAGTALIACSASAVIVSEGLTPTFAGIAEPSQTSRFS